VSWSRASVGAANTFEPKDGELRRKIIYHKLSVFDVWGHTMRARYIVESYCVCVCVCVCV
jgi:hypothetical protein